MTDDIHAPMSPTELPQQRINAVVDLPSRPEGFEPVVDYGLAANGIAPKRRPTKMAFLGGAEWAWSPMHNRVDAYYLHRGRRHWILYQRDLDPNDPTFAWSIVAYALRRGIDERTAAVHLMIALWRMEVRDGLDEFH